MAGTQSLTAVADSHVSSAQRTNNFGTAKELVLEGTPRLNGYVRFAVPAVGRIDRAVLNLYATKRSTSPLAISAVAGSAWDERTINYNNAPAISAVPTASIAPFAKAVSISADVTPLVSAGTPVTLGLTSPLVLTDTKLSSRETRGREPRLDIVFHADPPVNTAAPTVTGTMLAGERITAGDGTWSGDVPMAFDHRWRRCDASGDGCADIAGATSGSYDLTPDDAGHTVRVSVGAANEFGRAGATSASTAVVRDPANAPVNTAAPTVAGNALTAERITADQGTWSGDAPIAFGYQWRRCDTSGDGCADIAGATSNFFDLTADDRGHTLRVSVEATNDLGRASATSAATAAVRDPFIMAAGDIACNASSSGAACKGQETSDLLVAENPDAVLPLGDTQYECGELGDFQTFYHASWGRVFDKTRPVVGNHEYTTSLDPLNHCFGLPAGAPGYFTYFGSRGSPLDTDCTASCKGYYSWDIGAWHMIALNSNCARNFNCNPGDPQLQWLESDLAAHPNQCTLAYWHHPLFTSGQVGPTVQMRPAYQRLFDAGVDVVLNGHDHDYERFAPLDPTGQVDPVRGIREFVVGTGGRNMTSFTGSPRPGSERRSSSVYGVMRLDLAPDRYTWQMRPIAGGSFSDGGSQRCHSAPVSDTSAPTAPTSLRAATNASNAVDLSWGESQDDEGVVAYRIFRDGQPLTTTGAVSGYTDTTVALATTYTYEVHAVDGAGNVSDVSSTSTVTISVVPAGLIFGDGFETGNLSRWTTAVGLSVQQQEIFSGNFAVRGTTSDGFTYLYRPISPVEPELYYRLHFKVFSRSTSINLLKFRNTDSATVLTASVSSTGKLALRNGFTEIQTTSPILPADGDWHELQIRLRVGDSPLTEAWFDGVRVDQLSAPGPLGVAPINRIQLGDNSGGHVYDVAYDDVALGRQRIP